MNEKSIVIVGAGMAGLSAGCYARMNGYKATILEMHSIPGGLCTAWTRKGYTFDISMHMLTGSKSGPLHDMWRELGVMENRQFHYHSEMCTIESGSRRLSLCTDRKRLEEQLLVLSPADAELSREFVRLVCGPNMMGAMSLKPAELATPSDFLRMSLAILPVLGTFRRYGKQTIQEFAGRFQDSFLREAIRMTIDGPGWPMVRFPMVAMAGFFKSSISESGVPRGGSQQVAYAVAERFKKLGGDLRLRARVADVLVENNRAVGVKLADGGEVRADEVIWAGDGHRLIFDILGGRYVDDKIRRMYDEWTRSDRSSTSASAWRGTCQGNLRASASSSTGRLPWPARNGSGSRSSTTPLTRRWPPRASRRSKSGTRAATNTGGNWRRTGRATTRKRNVSPN